MSNELVVTTKSDLENLIRGCIREELSPIKEQPNAANPLPEILTIEQATELLNLAKPTIYTLTSKREIPFFKNGKKLYFKRSELLQWIEKGKKKTVSEEKQEMDKYLMDKSKKH